MHLAGLKTARPAAASGGAHQQHRKHERKTRFGLSAEPFERRAKNAAGALLERAELEPLGFCTRLAGGCRVPKVTDAASWADDHFCAAPTPRDWRATHGGLPDACSLLTKEIKDMCSLDQVIECGSPVSPFGEYLGVGGESTPDNPPRTCIGVLSRASNPVPWPGQNLGWVFRRVEEG